MTASAVPRVRFLLPGLAFTVLGVAAAYLVSLAIPVAGPLTSAVLLGVVAGSLPVLPAVVRQGVAQLCKRLLRAGVVLLGLQLALAEMLELGAGALLAVLLTVAVTFLGTLGLGRLIGAPRGMAILVATGFSVCGASAIAAVEGVVERRESDVATAVALVTCFGSLSIVAVPLVGEWIGLTGTDLGEWAGLSVHEVAQVVAAASPAGTAAVTVAIVVKLSRVVLLAPIVTVVSVVERRRRPVVDGRRPTPVPLFVAGFLAMMLLRSSDLVPATALDIARAGTTLLLAGALFGLGCGVRVEQLARTGGRALVLGLLSTLLVGGAAFTTLALLT
jgi:uncharacterized integral membrane protein (TIGR00698 family)